MVPDYLDTLPISHVTVWHFNRKNGTKLCKYLKQKIFKKSLCWSLSALIVWPKKANVRLSELIRLNTRQWHSYEVRFSAKLKKTVSTKYNGFFLTFLVGQWIKDLLCILVFCIVIAIVISAMFTFWFYP